MLISNYGQTFFRNIKVLTKDSQFQALVQNWKSVPYSLWNIDLESGALAYWLFTALHSISWLVIYGGMLKITKMILEFIPTMKQRHHEGWHVPQVLSIRE